MPFNLGPFMCVDDNCQGCLKCNPYKVCQSQNMSGPAPEGMVFAMRSNYDDGRWMLMLEKQINKALYRAGYRKYERIQVTLELWQDLKAIYSLDPPVELVNIMKTEMRGVVFDGLLGDNFKKRLEHMETSVAIRLMDRTNAQADKIVEPIWDDVNWYLVPGHKEPDDVE